MALQAVELIVRKKERSHTMTGVITSQSVTDLTNIMPSQSRKRILEELQASLEELKNVEEEATPTSIHTYILRFKVLEAHVQSLSLIPCILSSYFWNRDWKRPLEERQLYQ